MANTHDWFEELELLNIKTDVWIDEEKYWKVYESIRVDPVVKTSLAEILKLHNTIKEKEGLECALRDRFRRLFRKRPETSVHVPDLSHSGLPSKHLRPWRPLLFAKHLRAKLMENGTDPYTNHLDDIVVYLQRNLPCQTPKNYNELRLQDAFFQEMAASGKAGQESLGYAIRALEVAQLTLGDADRPCCLTLYTKWAELNKAIGLKHSGQMREAAVSCDKLLKEFLPGSNSKLREDLGAKKYRWWRKLLYEPAVLLKAEILQSLQHSYHVLETLELLRKDKTARKLLLKAQAYKDIGRLDQTEKELNALWGQQVFPKSVKEAFKAFDNWQSNSSPNLSAQCLGTLLDYYLEKFESGGLNFAEAEAAAQLTDVMKEYFVRWSPLKLEKIKSERKSFYQQLARWLQWLAENPDTPQLAMGLYKRYKDHIFQLSLADFARYEYDIFTESMDKFYRNIGDSYHSDEEYFTNKVTTFETERQFSFHFKMAEREHRADLRAWTKKKEKEECNACLGDTSRVRAMKTLLPTCRKIAQTKVNHLEDRSDALTDKDYEAVMSEQNCLFMRHLVTRSRHDGQAKVLGFMGLQRWNSSTPALALSLGGGYFIYRTDDKGDVDLGIALDPGFDFVENLFRTGFTLSDVDIVLISHGHADHIRDFEPLIDLLHFMKRRRPKDDGQKTNGRVTKRIHAVMSLGVYDRLKNVIADTTYRQYLADTYIIDLDKGVNEGWEKRADNVLPSFSFSRNKCDGTGGAWFAAEEKNAGVTIRPTWAYHDDKTGISDSFGFRIQFETGRVFGYTGDSKWVREHFFEQYLKCDVILVHLGSLIPAPKGRKEIHFSDYGDPKKCRQLIADEGHPYIFGLLRLLTEAAQDCRANGKEKKLILLSEFGEELKGKIRIDFTQRLNDLYGDVLTILPVDVGLNVRLDKTGSFGACCLACNEFADVRSIRPQHYGHGYDEALFYFCNSCLKSKPPNVLQSLMHKVCEFGFPLHKAGD